MRACPECSLQSDQVRGQKDKVRLAAERQEPEPWCCRSHTFRNEPATGDSAGLRKLMGIASKMESSGKERSAQAEVIGYIQLRENLSCNKDKASN